MTVRIHRPGKRDRVGKNLAIIYTYSRTHEVASRTLTECEDGSGMLRVTWTNGAWCLTAFASYRVMCNWVGHACMFKAVHDESKAKEREIYKESRRAKYKQNPASE